MTRTQTVNDLLNLFATDATLSKRSVECAKEAITGLKIQTTNLTSDQVFEGLSLDDSGTNEFIISALLNKLLIGRKLSHFLGLTFREFESFSKDANHLPAFGDKTAEFSKSFGVVKTKILIELLAKKSAEYPDLISKTKEELDLVAFNRLVKNGLSSIGLVAISADFSEIYFNKSLQFADFDVLETFLGEFYIKITGMQNLKVVAV